MGHCCAVGACVDGLNLVVEVFLGCYNLIMTMCIERDLLDT